MNYLAHAFLSRRDPGLIIGNFIADHIGNNFKSYPPEIIEGVKLHRRIDSFTDTHEKFRESKRIFYKGYEKYSGILVDIYFDHLLARNFHDYSEIALPDYTREIYGIYDLYKHILPQSSLGFLDYVLRNNIYNAYATEEGIDKVLYHLSHRIGHGILLNHSLDLFLKNEKELAAHFDSFFRDALKEFNL